MPRFGSGECGGCLPGLDGWPDAAGAMGLWLTGTAVGSAWLDWGFRRELDGWVVACRQTLESAIFGCLQSLLVHRTRSMARLFWESFV